MTRIKIKPISVNDCWQGRRFKTPLYESFEHELIYMLPKLKIPSGKLFLRFTAGISNKNADLDNVLKPILDILQKKYDFNDKQIYGMDLWKEDVKKGEEFVDFDLSLLD